MKAPGVFKTSGTFLSLERGSSFALAFTKRTFCGPTGSCLEIPGRLWYDGENKEGI